LVKHAAPLHSRPIAAIDRRAIAAEINRVATETGNSNADKFRAALSGLWAWMLREGLVEQNVVLGTNARSSATSRSRLLTGPELRAILVAAAAAGDQYGDIVLLLAHSGMRRAEVGDLCWSEVDLAAGLITLPPERTKAGLTHQLPITTAMRALLERQPRRVDRDLIFGHAENRGYSGWSKSFSGLQARLREAGSPVENWTLHDLRRAFSTTLHELGISPWIVEQALGHRVGNVVARTYNLSANLAPLTHALEAWGTHLAALVSGEAPAANVAELAQYRK
jgi:integrase